MKKVLLVFLLSLFLQNNLFSSEENFSANDLFYIDQMNSHNKNFALYFKTREKAILAKGENSNYISDYPKDLYIHNYETNSSDPLISYEWFPSQARYLLQEYDFPVFPDDFAYYLLKDNQTLIMISAVKSLKANFKFDINKKKIELYPSNGKFDFIISSFAKNCGHSNLEDNYKCSLHKPLISSNLIN